MSMEELRRERDARRTALSSMGCNPYGKGFPNTTAIAKARTLYPEKEGEAVQVAGRVVSKNDRGKLIFFFVKDSTEKIQVMASKAALIPERTVGWEVVELLQPGDIVGIVGTIGASKTGEISIKATEVHMLSKSMMPWPDQYYGLTDVETLHRNRPLELVHSPNALAMLKRRSDIVWKIRQMLHKHGYMEVETPVLQPIAGGASARPFETHHNAYNMPLYLRIAPELYLKKLLVGGIEKIYEIGKNFRNEGVDKTHNPEFTMLELYEAFGDADSMAWIARRIFESVGADDLANAPVKDYLELLESAAYTDLTRWEGGETIWDVQGIKRLGIKIGKSENWLDFVPVMSGAMLAEIFDEAFDKLVLPNLSGAVFVNSLPAVLCPLAKPQMEISGLLSHRWELYADGVEIANAYSEINEPELQRRNFELQLGLQPGTKDPRIDEEFLSALDLGMPPAGGLGIGIDRLAMRLVGTGAIRDVITFPLNR